MSATADKTKAKDERKDRAIVSLPDDVKQAIDAKRNEIADANRATLGVSVSPTRGQLVESILREKLEVKASD